MANDKPSLKAHIGKQSEKHLRIAKPITYWSVQKDSFLSSFLKFSSKVFWQSMIFDFLALFSLLLVLISGMFFINMISAPAIPEIMEIYALSQAGNTEQVEQALVDYAPVFSRILWLSLLVVFIGSLLGLFFISVFYGKAWALALNKRISSSFVIKYFLFNLLWFLAWFLLLVFVLLVLKAAAASLALLLAMLIFIYADPVMRCLFDEKRSVKHNFSSLFRVAVRFRWFIFFIITAFLLGILLMMVLSLFQSFNFAFAALSIAFTLIFLGWMRNYSISLANGIHKAR